MSEAPHAVIFGCEGVSLTDWETGFFHEMNPLGFILFARNIDSPAQVGELTARMREIVGRPDAPILIDQEGGRVQRLSPPHWRAAPAAGRFGSLALKDKEAALRAARLNARLIARELSELGINVDCLPCLDLRRPEGHAVIGDRSFGVDPHLVSELGRSVAYGLRDGGVIPVIKHLPGHGRAAVDSHLDLPLVDASRDDLERTDFEAFRGLRDAPWGMTAHVVYESIDPRSPATVSPEVIGKIIRDSIGFGGLLLSDDLSMSALSGGLEERARESLMAGCDVALHCNGNAEEMAAVAGACGPLSEIALERLNRGYAWTSRDSGIDARAALQELESLLA